jgi:hypothetical protein
MKLALHHRLALPAALGLSAIAIFDAITHGVTGHWSVFADDSGSAAAQALGAVVHGLAYLGALWVLYIERRRFRANRAATVFGWLLVAAFAPLAAGFLLLAPFGALGQLEGALAFVEPVIGIAFGLQFLAAAGLGLSLLRHPETGVGSRILAAIPLVLGLTLLLIVVAPDWSHPAYLETFTIVGASLIGTADPGRRSTSASEARTTPELRVRPVRTSHE